jgi:hypothetical protein
VAERTSTHVYPSGAFTSGRPVAITTTSNICINRGKETVSVNHGTNRYCVKGEASVDDTIKFRVKVRVRRVTGGHDS